MTKPRTLTKIRSNMNIKAAAQMREAELAAHAAAYAEACRQTNAAFGDIVLRESKSTPLSHIAIQLGMNRPNLHRLANLARTKTPAAA